MTYPPLDEFFHRSQIGVWYPTIRYQSINPSPCTFGPIDANCQVKWRPLSRPTEQQFSLSDFTSDIGGLSEASRQALAATVQFVTSYWCAPIDCRFGYDRIVLDCGAWNEPDLERKCVALKDTIESFVDTRTPTIIPLAWSSSDSGFYIGIDVSTGEICASELGRPKGEPLAASLSDFLSALHCVNGYFRETVSSF